MSRFQPYQPGSAVATMCGVRRSVVRHEEYFPYTRNMQKAPLGCSSAPQFLTFHYNSFVCKYNMWKNQLPPAKCCFMVPKESLGFPDILRPITWRLFYNVQHQGSTFSNFEQLSNSLILFSGFSPSMGTDISAQFSMLSANYAQRCAGMAWHQLAKPPWSPCGNGAAARLGSDHHWLSYSSSIPSFSFPG